MIEQQVGKIASQQVGEEHLNGRGSEYCGRKFETMSRACVIGSGPNGLASAIVLAQAGMRVDVYEAEAEPGGAARSLPLTLPGFLHDFGSAVHPFAVGSPFFSALPLTQFGLEWIHGSAAVAHPLEDGTAVLLERDLTETALALGEDGKAWKKLMQPLACLLYTSPSPRDISGSRMPSSA